MRSFEDRWAWLRSQLEDDAATLAELADATADPHRARHLHGKAAYAVVALQHMDTADVATGPNA